MNNNNDNDNNNDNNNDNSLFSSCTIKDRISLYM